MNSNRLDGPFPEKFPCKSNCQLLHGIVNFQTVSKLSNQFAKVLKHELTGIIE